MIKSRLRMRRTPVTITVKNKSRSGVQYSEGNAYTGLVATHEQPDAYETLGDAGAPVLVTDVFWFEAAAGASLPVITEAHVLVDGSGTRYEVIMAQDQGGNGSRLKVATKRLRGAT